MPHRSRIAARRSNSRFSQETFTSVCQYWYKAAGFSISSHICESLKGVFKVKRLLIITLSVVLFSNLALAQTANTAQSSADEKAVTQLVHEWLDALVKSDFDALNRIIADDYIITNSDGSVLGKQQDLEPLKAGLKFESASIEDLKVRVYGETAVVTGVTTFKGSFKGREFTSRGRFTDVWLKRDGRWQAIASQESALPKQASVQKQAPAQQQGTVQLPKHEREKLLEDFQIARSALEEGHSGIYRYTSKEKLDRIFDEAAKSLYRPMTALEFYRLLAPAVAAIKCGHTSVSIPDALRQEINSTPVLPLHVRVLGNKVYVLRDFSSADHKLAGKEIRSVNGVPASRIVAQMIAATPGDGDVQTSRQWRISRLNFSGLLVTLMDLRSPYDLVVADAGAKREEKVHIEGIELPKLREASKAQYPQDQPSERAGEFKFLDDGKIAVMKINGFGGWVDAEKKKGLREFYKESFEQIQAKGSTSLIIDLRNNGGGEDELGKLLLSYLIDEPFKYYDDLIINNNTFNFAKYTNNPTFKLPPSAAERRDDGKYHRLGHPNSGINQPNKPTFTGKVLILINGGSFSTTSEFLSQAHFHKRATFIGEESGGGYYGNSSGSTATVTLPNTKLTVRVPLMTYYMAVSGYKAASHGVVPDHPVQYSIAELIEGTDKDMEAALKLARK
jgi:C-terminal processing protease CtpA/Prc/ketosteroid isomerase-like protein